MEMSVQQEIPFQNMIGTLLDESTPLDARYLYRLSDLSNADLALLEENWERISLPRRQALMLDLEELTRDDFILSFAEVGQLAVKDEDSQVRLHAVRTLTEYEINALIPVFLNMLEEDEDVKVRAACATALSPFDYLGEIEELPQKTLRQIEDRLLKVTNGSDDQLVRRRALEALGFSSRKELPPLIESAYHADDDEWLITALFAMGRSGNSRWRPHILDMLEHLIPAVRAEAATAAGELEISEAVSQLLEFLDDSEQVVRHSAIWALSQIGGEGVRETLILLMETTEDEAEAELIEAALDNLSFTEDMNLFTMMDYDEIVPDELLEGSGSIFEVDLYPEFDEEDEDAPD
jgi:HEAT repeat protein